MADLILRGNVDALSRDALAAFRAASAAMQSLMDNRGFNHFAGLHGVPGFYCWHHDRSDRSRRPANLFLPWHRAYLLYFENALRDQGEGVTLPWWDWTSDQSHSTGIPDAFAEENADGNPNPLFSARMFVPTANPPLDQMTTRQPGDPSELPTSDQIDDLITNHVQFQDFSGQIEDVHDMVHGWTGGDMGVIATAAFDPIFWSHHCMIDRLWYLWQLKNGVNNIPHDYLDIVLEPFGLKVSDVLDIHSLGYDYASSSVVI